MTYHVLLLVTIPSLFCNNLSVFLPELKNAAGDGVPGVERGGCGIVAPHSGLGFFSYTRLRLFLPWWSDKPRDRSDNGAPQPRVYDRTLHLTATSGLGGCGAGLL